MTDSAAPVVDALQPLALFPLRQVLFPGARLALRVFEARYLDLVADCLRRGAPFGVVCLTEGGEVRRGSATVRFARTGVLARIDAADAQQPGLLQLRCTGTQRFRLSGEPHTQTDGLWVAPAQPLADDTPVAPPAALQPAVQALAQLIERLRAQGDEPFAPPLRLDDAGWVANRWGELLPIELALRQQLLELDGGAQRLQRVQAHLAELGVLPAAGG